MRHKAGALLVCAIMAMEVAVGCSAVNTPSANRSASVSEFITPTAESATVSATMVPVIVSAPVPTAPATIEDAAIAITYSPIVAQEGTEDVLKLEVTIENRGYETFSASPNEFAVVVGRSALACDPARSQLAAVKITDGSTISGTLIFIVPSGTSLAGADLRLTYSGALAYTIWYFSSPLRTQDDAKTPVETPTVFIAYATSVVSLSPSTDVFVVSLAVQNSGYEFFDTSPAKFSLVLNNRSYSYDPDSSDLRAVNVPNGGRINGKLAFRVPSGAAAQPVGITVEYSGTYPYTIRWIERR